jgi:hypothetical protein
MTSKLAHKFVANPWPKHAHLCARRRREGRSRAALPAKEGRARTGRRAREHGPWRRPVKKCGETSSMPRVATAVAATSQLSRGEVHDPLYTDRPSAKYLGRSASWLRARRAARVRALRSGASPTELACIAPAHIVLGKSIFYRLSALNAYIVVNGVQDGQVAFSNRPATTTITTTTALEAKAT